MSPNDAVMIERLVERTGMSRSDIEAVLRALTALGRPVPIEGAWSPSGRAVPGAYQPSEHEIDVLIVAASRHPLGTEFLLSGHLGTVAIMFGVHAFTVDAARLRLRGGGTG